MERMNLESEIEESLWDFLKDRKEGEDVEALSSTESSVIPHDNTVTDETESRVVYFKKRKYEKRQDDADQWTYPVLKRKRGAPAFYLSLPRILKNDIRRKYMLMYANVMNSFNYHLISSFFEQFFLPSVKLVKYHPFSLPQVLVQGVDAVMSYFLLLLQMCPDKVTEISDIQLKQSVADMERTEICCKFNVKNTRLYDLTPLHFLATLEDDLQKLTINDQNTSPTEIIKQEEDGVHGKTKKKRTLDSIKTDKMEKHQLLFDPISGIFLQSRFPRSESPIQYQVEGNMTLVVDQNKRIESIIINPKERVQLPRK